MKNSTKRNLFVLGIPATIGFGTMGIFSPIGMAFFLGLLGIFGACVGAVFGWVRLGEKIFPYEKDVEEEKKQLYSADDMDEVEKYVEEMCS